MKTAILPTLAIASAIRLVSGTLPAQAQTNPQSSPKPATSEPLTDADIPDQIVISRFQIIGNKVLPQAEIDRVLKPYLFRPLTFTELLAVQQALTQLYINNGYITSGAYIPPQTISDRTVKIEIIEGKIEEIKILGLNKLRPGYIRSRLEIATQPPLNQDRLLNALEILQLDPLIGKISAELSKGINPGGSFLRIEVEEAKTSAVKLSVNNRGSVSIGSVRRGVTLQENNFLGYGDRLSVAYVNTTGSNSLEDLSYVLPVGAYNGKISLVHSINNSRIVADPFQDLDFESQNRYYSVGYSQPLYQKSTRDITLGFTVTKQDSQLSLMNVGFPFLARGSNSQGETSISALRLFQEYSDRRQNYVFAARSQFSLGLDLLDATINSSDLPDSKFLIWRGQAQYLQKLNPKTNLFLRWDLQLADRPLVSLEQFSSGGALSVRGYAEQTTLADNGLFLSAELKNTVWQVSQSDFSLELNPFFDFARVWNSDDLLLDTNTLASVGISLQLVAKDNLTARLDWGLPLANSGNNGGSLQEQGVHFSLDYQP